MPSDLTPAPKDHRLELSSVENFVGGAFRPGVNEKTTKLVDPATGAIFATATLSDLDDIDFACRAATSAFEKWRLSTPAERALALSRIADSLEQHSEEFVHLESKNTGKPLHWVREEEIPAMLDHIRFFASAARSLLGTAAGEYRRGLTSVMRREPIGVCAQVAPWNYPMMMAVWKWAPAIAAGNTVVLKPAETTPVTTVRIAELASEHLPAGALNVICGDRNTGRALVAHPVPAMVSVTGSVQAGIEVSQAVATDLKRVHLELGGKAPVLVFPDVDLDKTVTQIAEAGYGNAGQDCTAATRVLVHETVHDDFVAQLAQAARDTRFGPPADDTAYYGPLNSADQLERVSSLVNRTPQHAEVIAGGHAATESGGFFFEPTVITGLRQEDELIQTEIFGPVITVQSFSDEMEAVQLANSVEYGLAASIWTEDHRVALRVSGALDFGTVWINCHLINAAEMPNAGYKHSGDGSDLSLLGLEHYTRVKHVMSLFG